MAKNGLTALQRKAGADRPPPDHGVMSSGKALRLALTQAGDDLLGAAILTGTVEEARSTVPQMAELIDAGALVVLLEGGDRSRGLAILDPGALTAVIEALTTGHITAGEPPSPPRSPTATDAFLTRRFLTVIMGAFAGYLRDQPEAEWAIAHSATEQVRDIRNLPLMLDDLAYRVISAPLDFDGGTRQGTLRLVLPWGTSRAIPRAIPAPETATDAEPDEVLPVDAEHSETARQALLQGEIALDAILHRQRLPLSALLGWSVGDLVSFPAQAIASVSVVDTAGVRIATARLGQASGQRALKLIDSDLSSDHGLMPLGRAAHRAAGIGATAGVGESRVGDLPAASAATASTSDPDHAPLPNAAGTPDDTGQVDPSHLPSISE